MDAKSLAASFDALVSQGDSKQDPLMLLRTLIQNTSSLPDGVNSRLKSQISLFQKRPDMLVFPSKCSGFALILREDEKSFLKYPYYSQDGQDETKRNIEFLRKNGADVEVSYLSKSQLDEIRKKDSNMAVGDQIIYKVSVANNDKLNPLFAMGESLSPQEMFFDPEQLYSQPASRIPSNSLKRSEDTAKTLAEKFEQLARISKNPYRTMMEVIGSITVLPEALKSDLVKKLAAENRPRSIAFTKGDRGDSSYPVFVKRTDGKYYTNIANSHEDRDRLNEVFKFLESQGVHGNYGEFVTEAYFPNDSSLDKMLSRAKKGTYGDEVSVDIGQFASRSASASAGRSYGGDF